MVASLLMMLASAPGWVLIPALDPAAQPLPPTCRPLSRSDTGVAALSCCLWITQLLSVVHGRQSRAFSKVGAGAALLC